MAGLPTDGTVRGENSSSSLTIGVESSRATQLRSSLEIMGCVTQNHPTNQVVPGIGATMSRPPSNMPDFGFVRQSNAPSVPAAQIAEDQPGGHCTSPLILFCVALFLFCTTGFSTTAAGVVKTIYDQIDKPVTTGHKAWLGLSIIFFAFSSVGLGLVLFRSPQVLAEIPRRACAFPWGVHWPHLRLQHIRWPHVHWPVIRMHRPFQSGSQSPHNLPHPKEIELADLENQVPRPPTPYPGTHSTQAFPRGRTQSLPLGFPVPPTTAVRLVDSRVSGMTNVSFRSDPRSVSPLSDMPPTPPPKDTGFSRFRSQEPLLPVAQSDTRASILTTLCDAVQLSNPDNEPGRAAQNYSPLAMASSPATGTTSRNSAPIPIQSPKPTYPIELASPSRGKERED